METGNTMHQADIDLKDINNTHRLSVLLTPDSLFCASFDSEGILLSHTSYTGIRYANSAMVQKLRTSQVISSKYPGGVFVAVFSRHHFCVPAPDDALASIFPSMKTSAVKRMKLPGQDIYHYFGMSLPQERLLDTIFGQNGYVLQSVAGLLACHYIAEMRPFIHIHVESGLIAIYASMDNNMVFYNHFEWTTPADIVYFAKSVTDSSGFTQETCMVRVSGWVDQNSQVVNLLTAYYPNTSFAEDFGPLSTSQAMAADGTAKMYFMHYINHRCG